MPNRPRGEGGPLQSPMRGRVAGIYRLLALPPYPVQAEKLQSLSSSFFGRFPLSVERSTASRPAKIKTPKKKKRERETSHPRSRKTAFVFCCQNPRWTTTVSWVGWGRERWWRLGCKRRCSVGIWMSVYHAGDFACGIFFGTLICGTSCVSQKKAINWASTSLSADTCHAVAGGRAAEESRISLRMYTLTNALAGQVGHCW